MNVTPQESKIDALNNGKEIIGKSPEKNPFLWFIAFNLRGAQKLAVLVAAYSLLTGVFFLLKLNILKKTVDSLAEALFSHTSQGLLFWFGCLILVLTLEAVLQTVKQPAETSLQAKCFENITTALARKVIMSPFLDSQENNYLVVAEKIKESSCRVFHIAADFIYYLPILLGVAWFCLDISPYFLLLFLILISTLSFLMFRLALASQENQKAVKQTELEAKYLHLLTAPKRLLETYVYSLGGYLFEKYTKQYTKNRKREVNSLFRSNVSTKLALLGSVITVSIALAIIFQVAPQSISLGVLVGFCFAGKVIWQLLSESFNITNLHLSLRPLIDEFSKLVNYEVPSENVTLRPVDMSDIIGLEVEDLSFSYKGDIKPVLEHITFRVRPGHKLAVIGESGSGKTTLLNLILGKYQKTSGEIFIGGIETNVIHTKLRPKFIGAVLKNPPIYPVTLRENITLESTGKESCSSADSKGKDTDTRLSAIIKKAGLESFVATLPAGLDTILSGKRLPESEKKTVAKKLALARVLYQNSLIVFYDDPPFLERRATPSWEDSFYQFLLSFTRTFIWFSQNPLSGKYADQIIFLKNGKIVERGSFDDLVKSSGEFASYLKLVRGRAVEKD